MRQGCYSLFLWPECYPDLRFETTTPGLIEDPSLMIINSDLQKSRKVVEDSSDLSVSKNKMLVEATLKNKLHMMTKRLPFAHLMIELPDVTLPC
jgi:hypothetical protein